MEEGDAPICYTDVSSLFNPTNLNKWWDSFRNKNGFDDLKFHELRHTQATQLLANGIDEKLFKLVWDMLMLQSH